MSLVTIDDRTRDALSRLTENEKLCLRRWLEPQTAKEMAIELGISPHAVEKRLKMARTRLGVSSSITAARLLARWEEDQPPVPQSPDLPGETATRQAAIAAAPSERARPRRPVYGGLPMIAAFCLLALVAQDTPAPPAVAAQPHGVRLEDIPTRKVDWNEAVAFEAEAFDNLDANHSGFLDPREASRLEPRDAGVRDANLPPAPPIGRPDKAAERKWMAKMDTDRDGKVSQPEYVGYMLPWILWQGVPAGWHAKR